MHASAPDDCCLTIVIAAFNEAEALPVLQPRIADGARPGRSTRRTWRRGCCMSTTGSRDAPWHVLRGFAARRSRASALLRLSRNFGKEAALTAGLDRIERGAAFILDADGQDPPGTVAAVRREMARRLRRRAWHPSWSGKAKAG
jgi:glycosyltransferase involved in cell wall biosynthesis